MTIPVVTLASVIVLSQGQHQRLSPDASSMASYRLHAAADPATTEAAHTGLARASRTGTKPAKSKQAQARTHVSASTTSPAASPKASAKLSSRPHAGASPSPSSSSPPSAKTTLTCTGTGGTGMLPDNYATIVNFLVAHGYTAMGAAGVAGNIYQESDGNPESVGTGGGGLIGWTPLPSGFVTGNAAADLQTQLNALLGYNQQWAQYIPALNAATTPIAAADIYMNDFERPGFPAAANREGAAVSVAQACGIS